MARYQTSDNNILKNQPVTAVTSASYTATPDNTIIDVNFAGAVTVTLPAGTTTGANANQGKFYVLKDISGAAATNNITVSPASGLIDGVASKAITANYGALQVFSDGTNWYSQAATAGASGVSLTWNMQKFTASGTYTPTANMIYCIAEVVGGGGGGGSPNTGGSGTLCGVGAGGGAGGYAKGLFTAAQIGVSQSITIGSGGAAAASGGTTSFGALLSGTGGSGGISTVSPAVSLNGSAGGTGSGGTVQTSGQPGGGGIGGLFPSDGNFVVLSGEGGSSSFGAGGRSVSVRHVTDSVSGIAGTGNGSGGSGGATAASSATGGAGTAGLVLILECIFVATGNVTSLSWTAAPASTTVVSNAGYYATGGSLVTLTLPASPTVGTLIAVIGVGAGGWRVQANGGQTMQFGNNASTSGGTISSTNQYDTVELLAVSGTQFVVTYAVGNLTLA